MTELTTEEDVRTKFVYGWLTQNGFCKNQISLETTVRYQLGRGEFNPSSKSGRIDLLVKSSSNNKKMILFEVKKPSMPVDQSAIDQACSYARVLKGNMAPVVVVTNAKVTKAYCSLTQRELSEINIEETIKGNFHYSDKNMDQARSEAIYSILSHKSSICNLCNILSSEEISILRGKVGEAKKFCDELYFDLFPKYGESSDVVLISGPPQSGKTNYLCHKYINQIEDNNTSIFFRSKSIVNGISNSIKDNISGLIDTSHENIDNIVNKILASNPTIFIDGLNEVELADREKIITDLTRLRKRGAKIIITCTDSFLDSIKTDSEDNRTELFTTTKNIVEKIILSPPSDKDYLAIVNHYKKNLNIDIDPPCQLSTINTIGKFYHLMAAGHHVEEFDNELQIQRILLNDKINLISRKDRKDCKPALLYLAIRMSEQKAKISLSSFCLEYMQDKYSLLPDSFQVHGLLEVNDGCVDFYDETYRDILLIEMAMSEHNSHEKVIGELASYRNTELANVCLFKYLSFYKIPLDIIEKLSGDTKIRILNPLLSYMENYRLATKPLIDLSLSTIVAGLKIQSLGMTEALFNLETIGRIIFNAKNITHDIEKSQYILGYCLSDFDFSSGYDLIDSPLRLDCIDTRHTSIYNFIGSLICDNYGGSDLFNHDYQNDIAEAITLFGQEAIGPLSEYYDKVVDNIFHYDSFMCSVGSYFYIMTEEYRITGDYSELLASFQILSKLKSLLGPTPNIDETINDIRNELKSRPDYNEDTLIHFDY